MMMRARLTHKASNEKSGNADSNAMGRSLDSVCMYIVRSEAVIYVFVSVWSLLLPESIQKGGGEHPGQDTNQKVQTI